MGRKSVLAWIMGAAMIPTALAAQTPAPVMHSPAVPTPMSETPLTGLPAGVAMKAMHNSIGFEMQRVEGKPIEVRPPEKADDKPLFPGQTRAPYHASKPFKVTTVTDKLNKPWSIAFLPDGKLLITEKVGTLRTVDAQGAVSEPVTGVPAVIAAGQVGLLDVALDPGFARNRRLFFSYSEPVDGDKSNIAVARAVLSPDDKALSDVTVIFRASPALPKTVSANQGGRIAIGRDGNLFVTIGDRSRAPPCDVAQNTDTHLGKIVRITPDGKPAPGNPFIGKAGYLPEIYALGTRSEEGLAFDGAGQLWETEHGPRGGDELNKIVAGKNYGWPVITHGIDYTGDPIYDGVTAKAGMEQPRYYWDPVIAPSGLAFYEADLFPQWKGSVFLGAMRGMFLDRLTLKGDKVVSEEPLLVDMKQRVRDVRVGPEGALYVVTDGGLLLRLTPN
jgi:glucose/arabinose dehydrogenase